jgi:CRISPR-associated endonuclease Cas1
MAATVDVRRLEQSRSWNRPSVPPRKRGEIVVVDGYGVRVRVERGRLLVEDGAGRGRQTRRFSRAGCRLERLVILGGSESLSLEAMRWLQAVGAGWVCIDRDGRLLCTSAPTRSEAKLRRVQALAPFNPGGLAVARLLLAGKLEGQQQLLEWLPADGYTRRVLADRLAAVQGGGTVPELVAAEAEAAAAYWSCWRQIPVRFRPADRRRLPEHWQLFGQRQSSLTGGGRMAVTPAGAMLNYLYALLEAEARLACLQVGLDPALAIVHADTRGRDSLPLDLMEAVRPSVDRYLLAFLRDRVFGAADFHETPRGQGRILPPLTHQLAETLPAWRQLLGHVTEQVTRLLLKQQPRLETLPTPLTGAPTAPAATTDRHYHQHAEVRGRRSAANAAAARCHTANASTATTASPTIKQTATRNSSPPAKPRHSNYTTRALTRRTEAKRRRSAVPRSAATNTRLANGTRRTSGPTRRCSSERSSL